MKRCMDLNEEKDVCQDRGVGVFLVFAYPKGNKAWTYVYNTCNKIGICGAYNVI